MRRIVYPLFALTLLCALQLCSVQVCSAQVPDMKWKIHDLNRPLPPVIDPGTTSTQDTPGRPPSDAVVLFDGKDLSHWTDKDGKPAKWKVENGYIEVGADTGNISTKDSFGDCQLHVEFAEPSPGSRRKPGARQQRRLSNEPLRNSGARFLREQNLRRRPGLRCLRTISAAGERLAPARTVADLRHHLSSRALQRRQTHQPRSRHGPAQRRPGARQRRHSPAPPRTASARPTSQAPTSSRSNCRITATRCASATSGFAN